MLEVASRSRSRGLDSRAHGPREQSRERNRKAGKSGKAGKAGNAGRREGEKARSPAGVSLLVRVGASALSECFARPSESDSSRPTGTRHPHGADLVFTSIRDHATHDVVSRPSARGRRSRRREHRGDRVPHVATETPLCEQDAKRFGSAHEGPGRRRRKPALAFPSPRLPVRSAGRDDAGHRARREATGSSKYDEGCGRRRRSPRMRSTTDRDDQSPGLKMIG